MAQGLRGGKIKQVKNMLKWAKSSESPLPDQSNAILSNFILTGLHAASMHAACTPVKMKL